MEIKAIQGLFGGSHGGQKVTWIHCDSFRPDCTFTNLTVTYSDSKLWGPINKRTLYIYT